MSATDQTISRELPRDRVLKELRAWIKRGRCLAGELFPTEAEISDELKASRSTVRVALKQLEQEGVLNVARGRGRVVAQQTSSGLVASAVAVLSRGGAQSDRFRHTGADKAVEAGVLDALRELQMPVLALSMGANPQELGHRIIAERPLGVVCDHAVSMAADGQEMMRQFTEAGIAVVGYGDHPALAGFDRVIPNHEKGAYELTRWLTGRGCRRLLRVWEEGAEGYWVRQRHTGFERAMAEAGLEQRAVLTIEGGPQPVAGEDPQFAQAFAARTRYYAGALAPHVLGPDCPDAIVATNDVVAMTIGRALQLLGKRVNQEILLAGYDDFWPTSPEYRAGGVAPAVTVDKHNDRIGETMARLLLDRVQEGYAGPARLMVIDGSLVTGAADPAQLTSARRQS